MLKGKVADHTIEEVGQMSLLYNTLRVDGLNVCITKMRPMYMLNMCNLKEAFSHLPTNKQIAKNITILEC